MGCCEVRLEEMMGGSFSGGPVDMAERHDYRSYGRDSEGLCAEVRRYCYVLSGTVSLPVCRRMERGMWNDDVSRGPRRR